MKIDNLNKNAANRVAKLHNKLNKRQASNVKGIKSKSQKEECDLWDMIVIKEYSIFKIMDITGMTNEEILNKIEHLPLLETLLESTNKQLKKGVNVVIR